jgi:hypothetical protein
MTNVSFIAQHLQTLYGAGNFELDKFRAGTGGGVSAEQQATFRSEIQALDRRIAAFETIITDGAKQGTDDFPYDAERLKREFMDEVLGLLLQRPDYRRNVDVSVQLAPGLVFNQSFSVTNQVDGQNLLDDAIRRNHTGALVWDGRNFSNMTPEQHKNALNPAVHVVYDTYSALIDAVFAEGNRRRNNPTDPATGQTVQINQIAAISPRQIDGIWYNRVTSEPTNIPVDPADPDGPKVINYFLIASDAVTNQVIKNDVLNTAGARADFQLGFQGPAPIATRYLPVNAALVPTGAAVQIRQNQRNLSLPWFLYFWNEARVRILRSQLAMKEAVTSEIRDDLAKANAVLGDLEAQAGKTRSQSADGKTVNPDSSIETQRMDIWEAMTAKPGQGGIFDQNGNDDRHVFSEWQSNRSFLKSYIDLKSTQSQDAMLDYQTTLNRYNNAFEVMSKIQEKIDNLLKSQLRNLG